MGRWAGFSDIQVGQVVSITDSYQKGIVDRHTVFEGEVVEVTKNGEQHRVVFKNEGGNHPTVTVQETGGHRYIVAINREAPVILEEGYYLIRIPSRYEDPRPRYVSADQEVYGGMIPGTVQSYLEEGWEFERIHTYDPETQYVRDKLSAVDESYMAFRKWRDAYLKTQESRGL